MPLSVGACKSAVLSLKKTEFIWLHLVLAAAHRVFDLPCSMWDLVP